MTKFIYQFTKSTAVSHCLRYFPKIASEVPLGVHQSTDTHPYTSHSSSPLHGRHCWQLPQSWCIQGHTPGCRTLVYRGTLPHTSHCPLQPHRSCCRFFHPFHRRGRRSLDIFFLVCRGTLPCTQHYPPQPGRSCCKFSHPCHTQDHTGQSRSFLIIL